MTYRQIAFTKSKNSSVWGFRWGEGKELVTGDITLKRAGNRWRIAELRVKNPTPGAFRAFSLTRLESAVNAFDLVDDQRKRARFRLTRPQSRRLPDDFYEHVARAYREAAAAGLNPRKTLAEDSGTPADTVARWIMEARRRGHLLAAAPGKVSA